MADKAETTQDMVQALTGAGQWKTAAQSEAKGDPIQVAIWAFSGVGCAAALLWFGSQLRKAHRAGARIGY